MEPQESAGVWRALAHNWRAAAAVTGGCTGTVPTTLPTRMYVEHPVFEGECYSRAARTALLNLAPVGSRVTLEIDPALDKVDRYGRLLRYVKRNSVNVNVELVRRGAAAPYFYRGERGRYANTLMTAALTAKAAQRGLWKACPGTKLAPNQAVDTGTSGPPASNPPPSATPSPPASDPPPSATCDPNYSGGCVPLYPPDVDCADIRALGIAPVKVIGVDVHRLDGDHDGLGCE